MIAPGGAKSASADRRLAEPGVRREKILFRAAAGDLRSARARSKQKKPLFVSRSAMLRSGLRQSGEHPSKRLPTDVFNHPIALFGCIGNPALARGFHCFGALWLRSSIRGTMKDYAKGLRKNFLLPRACAGHLQKSILHEERQFVRTRITTASSQDFRCAPPADGVHPADRSFIVPMTQIKARKVVVSCVLAFLLLMTGAQVAWCQPAERLHGVPNFGRVTNNLYRGGQPSQDGFNSLRSMGVGMVVNFREESGETAAEKREVESLGIKYVGIPWSATHKPPTPQVLEFLDLVRANPNTRIFVHCRRGADRTGVMIAAYRISVEHESVAQAVGEMHQFHYDWLFLPQLKHYVELLPELLQNDPQFAEYRLPSVKRAQSAP